MLRLGNYYFQDALANHSFCGNEFLTYLRNSAVVSAPHKRSHEFRSTLCICAVGCSRCSVRPVRYSP